MELSRIKFLIIGLFLCPYILRSNCFGSMAVGLCRLYKTDLLLFIPFSSVKKNAARGGWLKKVVRVILKSASAHFGQK